MELTHPCPSKGGEVQLPYMRRPYYNMKGDYNTHYKFG